MRSLLTVAAALALGGCFAADDFSDCTDDDQCGAARQCVAHSCVFVDAGGGAPTDMFVAPRPDAEQPGPADDMGVGPLPSRTLTGVVSRLQSFPGERVILDDVVVAEGFLQVQAAVIEVNGRIDANGAGRPGGGGGGGGAGGHASATVQGGAGAGGGENGYVNAGITGGPGGRGGDGDALGGTGGTENSPDGGRGEDASLLPPGADGCADRVGIRQGRGGGGGGGGFGGNDSDCQSGPGGAGGGAGGPGGGAVILEASQRLVVRAAIEARGLPADTQPALGANADADALCVTAGPPCNPDCDPDTEGKGGDGAAAASDPAGPGTSNGAGQGGVGGGGSGGMVRLLAPVIEVEGGASVDVSGSAGEANGGLVQIVGRVATDPAITGAPADQICRDDLTGGEP